MNKKGLTLVEMIISLTISAIAFTIVFIFIGDSLLELKTTNTKTTIMDNVFNTKDRISRSIRGGYFRYSIIGTGGLDNRVLLLKNATDSKGVIFGIVDSTTMQIQDYNTYGYNNIGYRELSEIEITNIESDNSLVYEKLFLKDKLIDDSYIKSFEPELYNSGVIINLNIEYILSFNESLVGKSFSGITIPKEDIYKINLNF